MRFAIWMPILLRIASAMVFVVAIVVAGVANRSALLVPMIAAVATFGPSEHAADDDKLYRNTARAGEPGGDRVSHAKRSCSGSYTFLVWVSRLLFQETDIAREFSTFDTILLTVPFGLALLFTAISMRSPLGNPGRVDGRHPKGFLLKLRQAAAPTANEDDGFVVDGEYEDKTDPPS